MSGSTNWSVIVSHRSDGTGSGSETDPVNLRSEGLKVPPSLKLRRDKRKAGRLESLGMKDMKTKLKTSLICGLLLAVVMFRMSAAEDIIRVSVAGDGTQATENSVSRPYISSDGRYVVFSSEASNLVADDTNGSPDVFVYDTVNKSIERVSVADDGTEGNAWSGGPSISGDGRYVAFNSAATNLVAGDTNGAWDTFVYDRNTKTVQRVSTAADGTQGDQGTAQNAVGAMVKNLHDVQLYTPSISSDGRYVAFTSDATNLIPGDTNKKYDIFVKDRNTGEVRRASVSSAAAQADNSSYNVSISPDGRYVVFNSAATNLVAGDTNDTWDTFVKDLNTGIIERVSLGNGGVQADGQSVCVPFISSDGRYVTFTSSATNLVVKDLNRQWDVFVYDRQTDTVKCVSVASDGTQANGVSYNSSISADGRYVAFSSEATNLAPGNVTGVTNVYVHDMETGKTWCASMRSNGTFGDGRTNVPVISPDGKYIVYKSDAGNLVSGDTNSKYDMFFGAAGAKTANLTMAVFPESGGSTTPTGTSTVDVNASTAITATAASDYHFVSWSVSGSGTVADADASETTVVLTGDATVTANFTNDTATLTMAVSPEAGGGTDPSAGTHTANINEAVTIKATAGTDYTFSGWTVSGNGTVADATSASTTVTLTGDAAVTANFTHDTATLTMAVSGTGTTDPSAGDHTVDTNTAVTITATAGTDYIFQGWTVSGDGTITSSGSATTAVFLTGNATVTAKFTYSKATLVLRATPEDTGTTSPLPVWKHKVNIKEAHQITATPADNYYFVKWEADGSGTVADTSSSATTVTLTGDTTLTAYFAESENADMVVVYPNGGEILQQGDTVSVAWTVSDGVKDIKIELIEDGNSTTLVENADNDGAYEWTISSDLTAGSFYKIKVSGTRAESADNRAVVTVSDESDSYFSVVGESYAVLTSPNGGEVWVAGTTQNITWNSENITDTMKVELYSDDSFDRTIVSSTDNDGIYEWEIPAGLAGSSYKVHIASTANASISDISNGNFAITDGTSATLTMAVCPGNTGTVDPSAGTHTVDTGAPTAVTASAADGYRFVKWRITGEGKVTDADRADTSVIISDDATLTALFVVDDGDCEFGKAVIRLNTAKENRDSIIIRRATLPDSLTQDDLTGVSFRILVDKYEYSTEDLDVRPKQRIKPGSYQVRLRNGRSRMALQFKLAEDKRYWNLTANKLDMASSVDPRDGVDIYLVAGDKMFGANVEMDRNVSWKFGDSSAGTPLSVTGTAMSEFSVEKANGRVMDGKGTRDFIRITKAALDEVGDFSPTTHTVRIAVDGWEKTMHEDSAGQKRRKNIWNYKGTTYSGAEYLLNLDFTDKKWEFKIKKVSLGSDIYPDDGIDVFLRVGDAEGGVRLDTDYRAVLTYPRKTEQ